MTTVLERPTGAPSAPPSWRVVRALAVREGRYILRHPLFLVGIAGSVGMIWLTTAWWQAPVLHRDDVRLAGSLLPLAAGTLLVSNLAAFRARRHGTEEIEDTTPASRSQRSAAHLTALLVPVVTALTITGGYVGFLYALGGIWAPSLWELLTGPAIVVLAAAVGVALARWMPSAIAGPLGILGLAAWQLRGGGFRGPGYTNWFVPFVDAGNENHVPELTIRPAAWHLLFLLGLAGALGVVALLRQGTGSRRIMLLAGALTLASVGGVMQSKPVSGDVLAERLALVTEPARQACETRSTVTYCVFPAYRQWIDRWDETVRRVLGPVPAAMRPRITIRQVLAEDELYWLRVHDEGAPFPGSIEHDEQGAREGSERWRSSGDIPMRTAWARGKDERGASLDLALAVGRKVIGVSEDRVSQSRRYVAEDLAQFRKDASTPGDKGGGPIPTVGDHYKVTGVCSTAGQAREAIGIWLALQAVDGSMDWLRSTLPQHAGVTFEELAKARQGMDDIPMINALTWHGASFVWTTHEIPFSRGGIRTAFDMMALPKPILTRSLADGWSSWISPTTKLSKLHSTFRFPPAAPGSAQQPPMWQLPECG